MVFNTEKNTINENYKLMAQTIIPRPIAWVVTEDEGVINVAPFSYFMALSSTPATVMISVGHKSDSTPKDTLANIRKHKKCTICIVDEKNLQKMHFSSKELAKNVSEVVLFGIDTQRVLEAFPPMASSAPAAYFCELNQEIDLGEGSTIPLILNVRHIFVDDSVITNKERLSIDFKPVARIGKSYAFIGEEVEAPRIP